MELRRARSRNHFDLTDPDHLTLSTPDQLTLSTPDHLTISTPALLVAPTTDPPLPSSHRAGYLPLEITSTTGGSSSSSSSSISSSKKVVRSRLTPNEQLRHLLSEAVSEPFQNINAPFPSYDSAADADGDDIALSVSSAFPPYISPRPLDEPNDPAPALKRTSVAQKHSQKHSTRAATGVAGKKNVGKINAGSDRRWLEYISVDANEGLSRVLSAVSVGQIRN
jgi:hypothetical protein